MAKRFPYVRKLKSENLIRMFFEKSSAKVFSMQELVGLIELHRSEWNLAQTTPATKIIDRLIANEIFARIEFIINLPDYKPLKQKPENTISISDENYSKYVRFVFGTPDIYDIANSINRKAYLSHYTAVYLNGLTNQIPKTVYITIEQSEKIGQARNSLTQKSIDSAFSKPQRRSESIGSYQEYNFVILKGKYTNRNGVIINADFSFTNLERTLIDITVRPNYAGGAFAVLNAYKIALEKNLSVNKLIAILKKLSFIYPYHQSVGFYLEKSGYDGMQLDILKSMPMEYDFYLDYNIEERSFSDTWRIYYPKGM